MSQIISSTTTVLPNPGVLNPCFHMGVVLDHWMILHRINSPSCSKWSTAEGLPALRHNQGRVSVPSAEPRPPRKRGWSYRPPGTGWRPPCPAWRSPSRCTCAAPSGCAGTAWPHGACSSALRPSPPSPRTWSTWTGAWEGGRVCEATSRMRRGVTTDVSTAVKDALSLTAIDTSGFTFWGFVISAFEVHILWISTCGIMGLYFVDVYWHYFFYNVWFLNVWAVLMIAWYLNAYHHYWIFVRSSWL